VHAQSPDSPSTTVTERPEGARITIFSSLRYRDFRYLWGSTFFTAAGNWIQQITLGWLIYDITGSAFLTGAVQGIRSVPFLFAGPLAGVIADRVDRKKFLIINHFLMAVLGLAFALMIASGALQVWQIFAFSLLSGIGWSANNPVRQALVPAVVPREQLMNAIALNSAAFNLTRIVGPAVGGVLIVAFRPATNFFIQGVSYAGVAFMVLPMHIPPPAPNRGPRGSMVQDMLDGAKYIAHEPTVLAIVVIALVPSLFMMPFTQGLMPVFNVEVLGRDAKGLGILLSSAGVGALAGTLLVAAKSNIERKGALLLVAGVLAGVGMMAFSQTTWLPVSMLALGVQGGFQMIYHATNNTVIQLATPDEYRGPVMSLYMLDHGLIPLGSLMAGALAELYGSPFAILLAGAVTTSMMVIMTFMFPALRRYMG
jgi:MFS family permease